MREYSVFDSTADENCQTISQGLVKRLHTTQHLQHLNSIGFQFHQMKNLPIPKFSASTYKNHTTKHRADKQGKTTKDPIDRLRNSPGNTIAAARRSN